MNNWVGSVILVGLVAGCDTPPDIHVRVFNFPREEADYRISTVLQGRRVAPAILAHVDPPFTSQPPVVAEPDTELRLSPSGPLPRFERVCFDVQRRGRWPEPVRSTRICTRFEKDKHLRQDVYFNWHFTCESGGGGDDCPLPAPNCRRLNERERSMLEAMTAAPTSEALADPSWGDEDTSAAAACAYECPAVVVVPVRSLPQPEPSAARDAATDAATDASAGDSALDANDERLDASDAGDASDRDQGPQCIPEDAAFDGADGADVLTCVVPP
jgi:hypothetical protein